jgi:hypothetical protein
MADVVCREKKSAGAIYVFWTNHTDTGDAAKKKLHQKRGCTVGDSGGDAVCLNHVNGIQASF